MEHIKKIVIDIKDKQKQSHVFNCGVPEEPKK